MKEVDSRAGYTGPLGVSQMTGDAKRAYVSYLNQRRRCYSRTNRQYHNNGGKGITVEYGPREFVSWWLESLKKRAHWVRPSCGRIDHSKSYSFDNIELQEFSENTSERNRRYPLERPALYCQIQGGPCLVFRSVNEAARVLQMRKELISAFLNGTLDGSESKLSFVYVSKRQKVLTTTAGRERIVEVCL